MRDFSWWVKIARKALFSVVVAFCWLGWGQSTPAAEVGTCEAEKAGKHLFFDLAQGKALLGALAELRVQKERVGLLEKRLEIKEEVIGFYQLQNQAAEKALDATAKALASEKQRVGVLELSVEKWQKEAASLRSARVWWLVGGLAGGVLVVGGAILTGWFLTK